jgi:hypothetical protein
VKESFLHVDMLRSQVFDGHYDIVGPQGEIVLPQVWEDLVEPGWHMTMHMWPMPMPPKASPGAPAKKLPKKKQKNSWFPAGALFSRASRR